MSPRQANNLAQLRTAIFLIFVSRTGMENVVWALLKSWVVFGGFNSGARGNFERHIRSGDLASLLIIIHYNYFILIKIKKSSRTEMCRETVKQVRLLTVHSWKEQSKKFKDLNIIIINN